MMLPALFISHGSPLLTIMNSDSSVFLKRLSSLFERPKYIIVISAHWVTQKLEILSCKNPKLIYDFFGFPNELYEKQYAIKNDINRVNHVINTLKNKHIDIIKNETREGYDHGVWSPLSLMYPNPTVPVIQLSLPISYSPQDLINLGNALHELREDTLIIGSGSMTHNLMESAQKVDVPIAKYSIQFRDWVVHHLEHAHINELIHFEKKAPSVTRNHPTLEHFLPLYFTIGSSKERIGKSLNNKYMYGNQSMDTILFKE